MLGAGAGEQVQGHRADPHLLRECQAQNWLLLPEQTVQKPLPARLCDGANTSFQLISPTGEGVCFCHVSPVSRGSSQGGSVTGDKVT